MRNGFSIRNSGRRIGWADTARGVAILLVIIGHTCPPPYTTAFIYAFHMPLFFVLSGLFLKVDEPLGSFVQKKARTLLVPFVIYNLVLLASDWCIVALSPNHHEAVDIPARLLGTLTGWHGASWNSSLWFLPCLFMAQLLIVGTQRISDYFARRSTSGRFDTSKDAPPSARPQVTSTARGTLDSWLTPCLWILLSLIGVAYCHWIAKPLPMSLDSAFVATGFLLMGRQIVKLNLRKEAWWYWVITLFIFISATLDNFDRLGGGDNHVDLSTDTLGNPLSFYLAACGGTLLLIRACQWVEERTRCSESSTFSFADFRHDSAISSKLDGARCSESSTFQHFNLSTFQHFNLSTFQPFTWLGRNSLVIYCLHRIPMNLGIAIWNAALSSKLPPLSPTSLLLLRSLFLLLFTLLLLLPAVYIVNRWFPWTLGKLKGEKLHLQ